MRSTLALVVGYPALLVGLSLGADSHWAAPSVALWLLLGVLGVLGFVASEMRSSGPLIPPRLLRNFELMASLVALLLFSAAYFPIIVLSPIYLQNVLSLSPLNLGLLLTTLPVVAAFCSLVSGRLADRREPRVVTVVGLMLGACGVMVYASLGIASHQLHAFLALALVGAGVGLVLPANQKVVFGIAPPEHYGVVGGLLTMCGPGAGALGIGVAVAIVEGMGGGAARGDPVAFVEAQFQAMSVLFPLPILASVLIYFVHRRRRAPG